jgi:hypothetical protein
LQDPSQSNGDSLKIVRRETSRNFRIEERENLKVKINDPKKSSKNKNISDM